MIETERTRRLHDQQLIEQAFGKKQQPREETQTWQERKRLTKTKRRALARRKSFASGGIHRRKTKKAARR